jgi:hypothetical protein
LTGGPFPAYNFVTGGLDKAKPFVRGGRKATGLRIRQPGCRRMEIIFGCPVFYCF